VLAGVSCTSASFCVAVGTTRGGAPQTFVQTWRGHGWSMTASPSYASFTSLAGAACVSESFCIAVGQHSRSEDVSTVAESFDGKRWQFERSPNIGVFSNLTGVSCISEAWCIAVGGHYHGKGSRTLVLRREGTWSLRPSPSHSFISGFAAVSCVSESVCVTVGAQRGEAANKTLIAAWDGSAWTIATSPQPHGTSILSSVSCVRDGGTWCVAVGSSGPVFGIGGKPLVAANPS